LADRTQVPHKLQSRSDFVTGPKFRNICTVRDDQRLLVYE
jgi:hypothetical protein